VKPAPALPSASVGAGNALDNDDAQPTLLPCQNQHHRALDLLGSTDSAAVQNCMQPACPSTADACVGDDARGQKQQQQQQQKPLQSRQQCDIARVTQRPPPLFPLVKGGRRPFRCFSTNPHQCGHQVPMRLAFRTKLRLFSPTSFLQLRFQPSSVFPALPLSPSASLHPPPSPLSLDALSPLPPAAAAASLA